MVSRGVLDSWLHFRPGRATGPIALINLNMDPHDPGVRVVALLPMFPVRHTIVHAKSNLADLTGSTVFDGINSELILLNHSQPWNRPTGNEPTPWLT